jgi:PAS domain S-box-containing protein
VVKLFVWKLQRLNADIQALFSLAACIGNRFDTETLSVISGRDPGECLALLFSDQAIDMLLPLAGGGGSSLSGYLHVPEAYTFIHDSLQQAAYSLIEPAALVSIHLKIGRLLLSILQPERLDERLFEVVNNLNAGFDLIQDNSEQVKVVELNVLAARKAFAGTAYSSALHYYRTAARFLEKPGFAEHLWRDYHELTLSLFVERTQCEFIEGNHNEAEKCIQQAEAHATSALETADVLKILIVQYTLMARYAQAISVGERALAALGIYLPGDRYEEIRDEEIAQIRQLLEDRSVASLGDLPVMSNSKMLMAAKILIAMGPPCYRSHQRLWSVIVPKVVNLTLHHGNIPQVGYSHTAFGGLLGWVDNDYATAKEFGELAERLMTSTFRSPVDQSVFYLMIGSSIRHWFKHLRHGTRDYEEAYEIGLRSGNLQYAAYAFGHNMYCRFYQGVPLSSLMQESLRCLEFSRTRLNQWAVDLLEGGLNVFGTLSGECPESNRQNAWSEVEYVRRVENHHNIQVACIYKVLKTLSLLVLGHCDHALVLSDETQPLIYTVGTQGLLPWPEHVFARLLILTSLYSKADEKRQTLWRVELDLLIRRLRLWADNCPENFEHKYLLSAAELARIDGRSLEAMPFYDKAIESARAGNFLQWEGMANERAHSFWMECGNERLAQVYWQQAYDCYNRWGAGAKVDAMETEFRMFIDKNIPVGGGDRRPAENLERQTSYALAERQIHQLRNYAVRMHQFELQVEAVTHAEELAHAMQRLGVEIAERGRAESALRESEDRFKSAFQHSPIGMALISPEGKWLMVNASACSIVGYSEAELLTMTLQDITHPADLDIDLNYVRQMLSGEIATYAMEKRYYHKEGFIIWVLLSVTMIRDKDGVPLYFISQIEDITKRKRAEDAVRESLREKESLLKEIHHRVKNNLQIVSSLLRLQSGQIDHSIAKAALKDMQNRVQSMALIHEHLYRSENLAQVDIAAYLQSLCPKLMRTLAARPDAIQLHMDLIPVYLDIDQAIPCGLLVNELISNALKHAFPSGRTGEVRLELRPVDDGRQIHLRVSDNGVGLPADFDMQRLSSLGLELASDLATQIRGRLEIGPGPGATFDVLFTLGNRMDSARKPGDTETRRKENE